MRGNFDYFNICSAKKVELRGFAPIGVLACPGATGLQYAVVAVIFRRGVYGTLAWKTGLGQGVMEYWPPARRAYASERVMGELVLLHFVQNKFTE